MVAAREVLGGQGKAGELNHTAEHEQKVGSATNKEFCDCADDCHIVDACACPSATGEPLFAELTNETIQRYAAMKSYAERCFAPTEAWAGEFDQIYEVILASSKHKGIIHSVESHKLDADGRLDVETCEGSYAKGIRQHFSDWDFLVLGNQPQTVIATHVRAADFSAKCLRPFQPFLRKYATVLAEVKRTVKLQNPNLPDSLSSYVLPEARLNSFLQETDCNSPTSLENLRLYDQINSISHGLY